MISDRHAWTRPELETVVPGVHRLPLPLPNDSLRAVNVYALAPDGDGPSDGAELTLIDGGWSIDESRDVLARLLTGIGAEPGDIRRFLVTHVHRDHYSQAVALRRAHGARVALGAGEADSLETVRGRDTGLDAQIVGLRRAGAPELSAEIHSWVAAAEAPPADDFTDPDEWLADGQELRAGGRSLVARETPGHTRGHLVFVDETSAEGPMLYAGDHVLPHITPSIGFEPAARPGALIRYLSSLAALRAEPDRLLLPAHGPVAPSVHERVDELVAHHDKRLDEIAAAVEKGLPTAAEIAGALRWTRREHRLEDMEAFNRMLAVLETDAHLEVLAAQGRVTRTSGEDEVFHHAPS
ncbi:glyoxylase-like metal-dependent hydrolase (beta-lactamase superfamily II) [Actinomycetospora succinea]|uniref:Glyoxylase-like metal-dependent hydrolase (Beta-lactamase superfamily II) n=1 Tax=Actinomycetospora succinea TaxID=663603 RepID=A0A4R6VIN4_9PSEU|nr:MBL fold metallo-hydrolase [Actinomycetospora succinea]TDQ63127.1 glyoxylase-like metal-dependent hydrolase (beta-lactamase superfamily II) [Actinomycetospora succinea]